MNEVLDIKSFGPLKEAHIVFNRITAFIGEQGTGKSSIAKIYSLFCWLEKALSRHQFSITYLQQYSRFRKNFCSYNNLTALFHEDTYLHYVGLVYDFEYQDGHLSITPLKNSHVGNAKVMYVPAERTILGCVDHTSKLKGIPAPLTTFAEEFDTAKAMLRTYRLPFDDVKLTYDKLNDIPWIQGKSFKVRLSEASSGYQSASSLLMVSKYLSSFVLDSKQKSSLDMADQKKMQKEVENIMSSHYSDTVKEAMLHQLSNQFAYTHFVNVVEEMELNLFPTSQEKVLYELLADTNSGQDNRLVLTTHSPYVINYLTLAVKAKLVYDKVANADVEWVATGNVKHAISAIVPKESFVDPSSLVIYQIAEGRASKLDTYDGLPTDANALNEQLMVTNDHFDGLLDIEEEVEHEGN
jgi:predicted ATPase